MKKYHEVSLCLGEEWRANVRRRRLRCEKCERTKRFNERERERVHINFKVENYYKQELNFTTKNQKVKIDLNFIEIDAFFSTIKLHLLCAFYLAWKSR